MKLCRTTWSASLLAGLLALGGCGPGVGGTGTGESQAYLQFFGATTALVCTAAFSSSLSCAGSTVQPGGPTSATEQGTLVTRFADQPEAANITVAIEANSILLDARCERLHFSGDWGITAAQDARFFGSYQRDPSTNRVPATLSVQTPGGTTGPLTLTLRDADGRVLLGPVSLQRVAAITADIGACP